MANAAATVSSGTSSWARATTPLRKRIPGPVQICGPQLGVGARRNYDRVHPSRRHGYERRPAWCRRHLPQWLRRNTLVGKDLEQKSPRGVVAHAADHGHRRTHAGRGHRLVEAFPSRDGEIAGATDRLTGGGQALYGDDVVEVEAPYDQD